MTKISTYDTDESVGGDDKWIGSDAQAGNRTKNFTPDLLADYYNQNGVLNLGDSAVFRFEAFSAPGTHSAGAISFDADIDTSFDTVSSFIISGTTLQGDAVNEFLLALNDCKVFLYKTEDINKFFYFQVGGIESSVGNPGFYKVTTDFIKGNGEFEPSAVYGLVFKSAATSLPDDFPVADTDTTGVLTFTDWNTFNGKAENSAVVHKTGGPENISSQKTFIASPVMQAPIMVNNSTGIDGINILHATVGNALAIEMATAATGNAVKITKNGTEAVTMTDEAMVMTLGSNVTMVSAGESRVIGSTSYVFMTPDGVTWVKSATSQSNKLDYTRVALGNCIYKFPEKTPGTYTFATSDDIASGTFTGSSSSPTNIVGITYTNTVYQKVGNIVTATIGLSITVSAANTATSVSFLLPVVRSSGATINIGSGILKRSGSSSEFISAYVETSTVDKLNLSFYPTQNSNPYVGTITFQYSV